MKTITFAIPCYNSAAYMDHCIKTLLTCGDDIEIILVDDGSTKDDTAAKADEWHMKFPNVIQAIHQENGGHGAAVNTGLENASGLYFKVVDSDDWLDENAMITIMDYLRTQINATSPTDLVIANYIYDKVLEHSSKVIRYRNVFPEGKEFGWDDVGTFNPSQYLLMHSVIYRTQLLQDMGLALPRHCFYVDNIFVYEPLPHVRSMRYFDVDMYHYFIGREDQSVNESVMMNRMDQQLRVTRTMIDNVDVLAIPQKRLRNYMLSYLEMMMCICSVFLRMKHTPESETDLQEIWSYLKDHDEALYKKVRHSLLCAATNVPTELGRKAGLGGYHLAQKIFKFN